MATPRDSNNHLCSSNVVVCRQLLCGSAATEFSKHGNVGLLPARIKNEARSPILLVSSGCEQQENVSDGLHVIPGRHAFLTYY